MKTLVMIAILFLSSTGVAQTARGYYNELYKAGGLDRMADGYVCFDDQPGMQTFFIFGQSKVLRQFLIDNGGFAKLSKGEQAELNRGFLNVRYYDRGVPQPEEEILEKDGDSWANTLKPKNGKGPSFEIRFTVAWETMRYRRSVDILNPDGAVHPGISRYGRCEEIPPDVRQKEH